MGKKYNFYKYMNNKKGISIIFVVVIMVVFLIIGASVITAASVSRGTAVKNIDNKQLYYYAKSTLKLIDDSVDSNNGIGVSILNMIVKHTKNESSIPGSFNCTLRLSEINGSQNNDVAYENVIVTLVNPVCEVKQTSPEEYIVRISKMTISFETVYRGQHYLLNVDYSCAADGINLSGGTQWSENSFSFIKVYQ